jgi:hypothetical protein
MDNSFAYHLAARRRRQCAVAVISLSVANRIDRNDRTGDVIREVGGQEFHDARTILHCSDAAERDTGGRVGVGSGTAGNDGLHDAASGDSAWSDTIHMMPCGPRS